MRSIVLILATLVAGSGAAVADSTWKEYPVPTYAFTVSFPAEPKVETTTYQTPDGRKLDAHVYSVAQAGAVFKMTIVDLADPNPDEAAVIDQAVKTLTQGRDVKVNIPARVSRVHGRQLSILAPDGSRSTVALFVHAGRIYQIEGIALPTGQDATADAIRFQQSLIFTDAALYGGGGRGEGGGRRGEGGGYRRDGGGPDGGGNRQRGRDRGDAANPG